MNVALWAEIRRLHEIEGLSARAIARRLPCCTKTVAKALAMSAPPAPAAEPRKSILDPYHARIDALVAKYPDLSAVRATEEISKGEDGYRGREEEKKRKRKERKTRTFSRRSAGNRQCTRHRQDDWQEV